ncbi:hypothetical protein M9H77_23392 [Catharanthus roseus]|uniref:Uncharacterized protein n=1 Tax=Catharanthus roseus TaxID=4058 RepID=A0ACC0AU45_CATRO|nr:hypothetical protein M9H77_23392 [Catharanthus roseus]
MRCSVPNNGRRKGRRIFSRKKLILTSALLLLLATVATVRCLPLPSCSLIGVRWRPDDDDARRAPLLLLLAAAAAVLAAAYASVLYLFLPLLFCSGFSCSSNLKKSSYWISSSDRAYRLSQDSDQAS